MIYLMMCYLGLWDIGDVKQIFTSEIRMKNIALNVVLFEFYFFSFNFFMKIILHCFFFFYINLM